MLEKKDKLEELLKKLPDTKEAGELKKNIPFWTGKSKKEVIDLMTNSNPQ